jgi:predicted nucleotidyltransferase
MGFELPIDFKELFDTLNANSVRYLLIGGYAVGVYGYSRATNDLDVFVSDDPENVERLTKAMADFGFTLSERPFRTSRSMFEIGVEPIKIQVMNFADGIDFDEAYSRRNPVKVEDIVVDTVSKEDLLRNKAATARYKDLADIERLERMDR